MQLIYNISIQGYQFLIFLASFFNPKAKLWINGRKNWQKKLTENLNGKNNIHWFHCASLGEFEQAKPLIEKIKKEQPTVFILITFFSPSGFENTKNYRYADYISYLPIDSKRNAKRFLEIVDISKAFFIKYEFWFHYFTQLRNKNIPFYIVSATFRKNQVFFKSYGKWYRNILKLPNKIFVQDKASQLILTQYNINSILSGDTRYDRVFENAKSTKIFPLIEEFIGDKFAVIAGSSWQVEEQILAPFYTQNRKKFKLIIAPHDISKSHIQFIHNQFDKTINLVNYSVLESIENKSEVEVLIIDNIGMLSSLYQYSDLAVIGGGFSNEIHNILEPATFGNPVFYGKSHAKFPEAKLMIEEGSGYEFESVEELESKFSPLFESKENLNNAKQKSLYFIKDRIGATDIVLGEI